MHNISRLSAVALGISSVTLIAACAGADALSPQAAALIAPVHDAYAKTEAELATMPPATTTTQKLDRLYDMDQAGRAAMATIDLSKLPKAEQTKATDAMAKEMQRHDLANQKALKELIPAVGWFKVSTDGDKAALTAFLIVQHATNDPQLMRDTLPRLKLALDAGEASGQWYALLFDRVAVDDHKPQRYGTQTSCVNGSWKLDKVDDPANLDARRKEEMGLKETEAEYLKHFSATC
jgi:hypothetical protein